MGCLLFDPFLIRPCAPLFISSVFDMNCHFIYTILPTSSHAWKVTIVMRNTIPPSRYLFYFPWNQTCQFYMMDRVCNFLRLLKNTSNGIYCWNNTISPMGSADFPLAVRFLIPGRSRNWLQPCYFCLSRTYLKHLPPFLAHNFLCSVIKSSVSLRFFVVFRYFVIALPGNVLQLFLLSPSQVSRALHFRTSFKLF